MFDHGRESLEYTSRPGDTVSVRGIIHDIELEDQTDSPTGQSG